MKLTIALFKEDECWIARDLDYLITQTGETKEQAIAHLLSTIKELQKEYKLTQLPINKEDYKDWEIITKELEIS